MRRVGYCLIVAYSLSGCRGEPDEGQTRGELGNGVFTYRCVDGSDPLCAEEGEAEEFPERIGVDGIFDVEFEPSDGKEQSRARILPAATGIVEEQNQLLHAEAPGRVALLAKRTSDGRTVDFIHVDVREIDGLRIEHGGSSPRTVWSTGSMQTLTVKAVDSDRALLAGAREFTWEVSDPRRVRLERANPTAAMELYPLAPGTVVITVSTGEVTAELEIVVEGEPVPLPDGGAADAASSDAGEAGGADGGLGVDGSPADGGGADAGGSDAADDSALADGGG